MVRVSYIISTRNRAQYLSKALDNVREFITPEDEFIVMDGASTDNTAEVVKANSDIVTVFRSEPDIGEAHAINKALFLARGEYIKFLTDDDYTFPEAMEEAIRVLDDDPSLDALLCGGQHCILDPTDGSVSTSLYFHLDEDGARLLRKSLRESNRSYGCGLGLILRRRVLPVVGLLDTSYLCCDTDYLARLRRGKLNVRYLDIKLYRHIDYPHSGVQRRVECHRDAASAFVSNGAWGLFTSCSTEAVAHALGLNELPAGTELAWLISFGAQLRASPGTRPFLWALGTAIECDRSAIAAVRRSAMSLLGMVRGSRKSNSQRCEEPQWQHRIL